MTTKKLTGTYAAGYGVRAPTQTLDITASSRVEGKGVYTTLSDTGAYSIVNAGQIVGADSYDGVNLGHGGSVTNGSVASPAALIRGYGGVAITGAAGSVTNF